MQLTELANAGGLIPMIKCYMYSQDNAIKREVNVILDCASTQSFVVSGVCADLRIKGQHQLTGAFAGFGGHVTKMTLSATRIRLSHILGGQLYDMDNVNIVENISADIPGLPPKVAKVLNRHLNTNIDWEESQPVEVLVGTRHLQMILESVKRMRLDLGEGETRDGLLWVTSLGKAASGLVLPSNSLPISLPISSTHVHVNINKNEIEKSEKEIDNNIEKFNSHLDRTQGDPKYLTRLLEQYLFTDLGPAPPNTIRLTPAEEACEKHFNETTTYDPVTQQYMTRLPFVDERRPQSNYLTALSVLHSVERGLARNPDKARLCHEAMMKYISNGHARLATEAKIDDKNCYYASWHAVQRPTEIGKKVRLVFNASLVSHGTTLNAMLHPGRSLIPRVDLVLTKFRNGPIGLSADVKNQFLEVKMHPDDQKYLRFLYRRPGSRDPIQIYCKCCAAFGLTSSPFHAQSVVQRAIANTTDEWADTKELLSSNLYVDNVLFAAPTEEEALKHAERCRAIFKTCHMTLAKFASNSSLVMNSIPKELLAEETTCLLGSPEQKLAQMGDPDAVVGTLGTRWDIVTDTLSMTNLKELATEKWQPTLRGVSAFVSSLYDPDGFLSPVSLKHKQLQRRAWEEANAAKQEGKDVDWDLRLSDDIEQRLRQLAQELLVLENFKMPRALWTDITLKKELHVFSDASNEGLGLAIYLRQVRPDGTATCKLVQGRSKLPPKQYATISRLELLGVSLAVNLATEISNASKHEIAYVWADNYCAINWCRQSAARWTTWVASRVQSLHDQLDVKKIRYVPTDQNICADLCSRGQDPGDFLDTEEWLNGPKFLQLREEEWPITNRDMIKQEQDDLEADRRKIMPLCLVLGDQPIYRTEDNDVLDRVFRHKFLFQANHRILACCIRGLRAWRQRLNKTFLPNLGDEMRAALIIFLRYVQEQEYFDVISKLRKGQPATLSRMKGLDLFIYEPEEVIRVGGRLGNWPAAHEAIYPYLLPHKHPLVQKMLLSTHKILGHPPAAQLLTHLSHMYWIHGGVPALESALKSCTQCQLQRMKNYQPKMAQLPATRFTYAAPFTHVAIDYCGPMIVAEFASPQKLFKRRKQLEDYYFGLDPETRAQKIASHDLKKAGQHPSQQLDEYDSGHFSEMLSQHTYAGKRRGRPRKGQKDARDLMVQPVKMKVHVLLVYCLQTRALVIEAVNSTSAEATVSALLRVFARRGLPEALYCDNATGFHKARDILHPAIREKNFIKIASMLNDKVQQKIDFHWGPPHGPWYQGSVERCVRTVKNTLHKMFPRGSEPTFDRFITSLAVVESMMNSRVLAVATDPLTGGGRVLTPSLLINGRHLQFNPSFYDVASKIKKQGPDPEYWAHRTGVFHSAYQTWCESYLKTLRPFKKWQHDGPEPQVNDLCAVYDRNLIKRSFPLAIIHKLNKSPDGKIRTAWVRQGEAKYKLPVARLFRLELQDNFPQPNVEPLGDD